MRRTSVAHRLGVIIAAVTTSTILGMPTAQAATWTPAATVSAIQGVSGQQRVAIDGAGRSTVVWAERRTDDIDVIKAAQREPGGSWSSAVTLSNSQLDAAEPQVIVSADGVVLAAWIEISADGRRVMAAQLKPGGAWGVAKAVTATGGVSRPRLAGNPSGDAIVMWHQRNGLRSSRLAAGKASWASPQPIAPTGRQHAIALDSAGAAHAVWKVADSDGIDRIKASRATANGEWGTARTLSRAGRHGEQPTVAVNGSGAAQVLWVLRSSRRVVQAAHRTAAGAWSEAKSLSDLSRNAVSPDVALDGKGNVVAVWQVNIASTQAAVATASRTPAGVWGEPAELSAAGASPHIGIDNAGRARAAWLVNAPEGTDRVESALRPASGSWSTLATIAAENDVWSVGLTVNDAGQASAVWRQSEGDYSRVRASSMD